MRKNLPIENSWGIGRRLGLRSFHENDSVSGSSVGSAGWARRGSGSLGLSRSQPVYDCRAEVKQPHLLAYPGWSPDLGLLKTHAG